MYVSRWQQIENRYSQRIFKIAHTMDQNVFRRASTKYNIHRHIDPRTLSQSAPAMYMSTASSHISRSSNSLAAACMREATGKLPQKMGNCRQKSRGSATFYTSCPTCPTPTCDCDPLLAQRGNIVTRLSSLSWLLPHLPNTELRKEWERRGWTLAVARHTSRVNKTSHKT